MASYAWSDQRYLRKTQATPCTHKKSSKTERKTSSPFLYGLSHPIPDFDLDLRLLISLTLWTHRDGDTLEHTRTKPLLVLELSLRLVQVLVCLLMSMSMFTSLCKHQRLQYSTEHMTRVVIVPTPESLGAPTNIRQIQQRQGSGGHPCDRDRDRDRARMEVRARVAIAERGNSGGVVASCGPGREGITA